MKLVTSIAIQTKQKLLAAVIEEGLFADLTAAHLALGASEFALPADMREFLFTGEQGLAAARAALDHVRAKLSSGVKPETLLSQNRARMVWRREELQLLGAVPRPGKIIHTAVNFRSHFSELSGWKAPEWRAHEWGKFHYEHPTGFLQAPSSVIGTDGQIRIPRFTKQLDYEIELAIIIGRQAKYVRQEDAMNYVAGFAVFNDVSARDIQAREHANKVVMLGKSFDGSCPLGPWLVTTEEFVDPQALHMVLKLNGEIRQDASTADMNYKIRDLVSWWSNTTLEPGDVITSGSPAGVIAGMENPVWLKPGDRIEATIDGIGTLTSTIAAEVA